MEKPIISAVSSFSHHISEMSPALHGRSCCEINEDTEIQPWETRWLGLINFLLGFYNLRFECDLLEKVREERKPRRERGLQLGAYNWNNSSISMHDEMNLSWQSYHEERISCSMCLWNVSIVRRKDKAVCVAACCNTFIFDLLFKNGWMCCCARWIHICIGKN